MDRAALRKEGDVGTGVSRGPGEQRADWHHGANTPILGGSGHEKTQPGPWRGSYPATLGRRAKIREIKSTLASPKYKCLLSLTKRVTIMSSLTHFSFEKKKC